MVLVSHPGPSSASLADKFVHPESTRTCSSAFSLDFSYLFWEFAPCLSYSWSPIIFHSHPCSTKSSCILLIFLLFLTTAFHPHALLQLASRDGRRDRLGPPSGRLRGEGGKRSGGCQHSSTLCPVFELVFPPRSGSAPHYSE